MGLNKFFSKLKIINTIGNKLTKNFEFPTFLVNIETGHVTQAASAPTREEQQVETVLLGKLIFIALYYW